MPKKTNENKPKLYRQGDVLVVRVDYIPDDVTPVKREDGDVVLAHGEITGHRHRIPSRHASLYRSETDALYMKVTAPVALLHEEHTTVKIPPGSYRITLHHEYQPAELPRQVVD